jgi:hypothetical protein
MEEVLSDLELHSSKHEDNHARTRPYTELVVAFTFLDPLAPLTTNLLTCTDHGSGQQSSAPLAWPQNFITRSEH